MIGICWKPVKASASGALKIVLDDVVGWQAAPYQIVQRTVRVDQQESALAEDLHKLTRDIPVFTGRAEGESL